MRSNQGRSYIKHILSESLAEIVKARGVFSASSDFSRIQEVEAVIICVPTPLNKNREPDISFILETGKSIAPASEKRDAGCAGINHLSRHHGRGSARRAGSGSGLKAGRGFPSGVFA